VILVRTAGLSPAHQQLEVMPSSYEQEPDNVRPQPSWWNMVIPFIIMIAAIALAFLGLM
jgi:hypothetical protein